MFFLIVLQEVHIMHTFNTDLYGQLLKICILDFIRPEANFDSLDLLIKTIKSDIQIANESLNKPEYVTYKTCDFFVNEK